MAADHTLANALFEWETGERRVAASDAVRRQTLERAIAAVLESLRRRLGSSFSVRELAEFYAEGVDWAAAIAAGEGSGVDGAAVIDAAFARYARSAGDFAGGRPRERMLRD